MKNRIRELRKAKGMTMKDLGKIIDSAESTVSQYETGKRQPDSDTLLRLGDFFDVSVDYLLARSEKKDSRPHFIIKDRVREWKSDKGARLYLHFDTQTADTLEIMATEEGISLEDKIENISHDYIEDIDTPEDNIIYFSVPEQIHSMSAGTGELAGDGEAEDLLLVKKPPRGTSYVARINGDSMEPTFRSGDRVFVRACDEIAEGDIGVFFMDGQQWIKELGDGELISHNPAYDPRPFTEDIRCQGEVLGVCDSSYLEK